MNIYYEQFSHLDSNLHFLYRYLKLIIIFKERNLKKSFGLENHHIFPRAFGGTNKKENMVYLTLKEHFIIHHLLWKSFPGNNAMQYAFFKMAHSKKHKNKITSKIFEKLRLEHSQNIIRNQTGKSFSNERKSNISNALKGRIWVTNGKQQKQIKPEFLPEYLNNGWWRGTLPHSLEQNLKQSNSTKGKIWINNGIEQTKIFPEQLKESIENGWLSGRLPEFGEQQSKNKKGMVWINNEIIQKQIKPEFLEEYLNLGWKKDQLPETRNKQKNSMIGRITINNDIKQKVIKPDQLQEFLDLGWFIGGLKRSEELKLQSSLLRKGKKYFNNGQMELLIGSEQFQEYLDLGWVNKRLYKTIREQNISK